MNLRRWAAAVLAASLAGVAPAANAGAAPAPRPRSFTFGAVGDLLAEVSVMAVASDRAAGTPARYDFTPLLAPVAPTISALDLAVCHLEGPLGRPGQRAGRYGRERSRGWRLLGAAELATAVAATGFDRCSTASNHSWDLGAAGLASTLEQLDRAGVGHAGTARTADEATPRTFVVNGVSVAHLAYTNTSNTELTGPAWSVAWGDPDRVVADVAAMRSAGAEVVIVSVHMGMEGPSTPDVAQRRWVEEVTQRTRIDLVVMHGPHVVQPVVWSHGTPVFFSVGNFLTGMGGGGVGIYASPLMLDGLLAWARFDEDPSRPGRFRVTIRPVALCVDPSDRSVHAAWATLSDPATPARLRRLVSACLTRTLRVVPSAS